MVRRSSRSKTERVSSSKRTTTSSKKGRSVFHRGSEAIERVDEELEQQAIRKDEAKKKAGQPLRFFMKPGETKEIVILDEKPDFFMYEHTIKDPRTGKWGLNLPCIKEYDNCPVCEQVKESIYTMFLSVLDLTGFEDRKGNWHDFSRKLLCVKPSQQKKYIRRFHKDGTLRGAIFEVTRDGDMDANIGNDIEFIEFMDEDELINDYISEWTDRDNKHHVENHGEVIDYESLFEEPTPESLRAIVGGEAPAGSGGRRKQEEDLDKSEDGWEDDDNKADDEWSEDEGEREESKPKRSSKRTSKRTTSRGSSRRSSREEEEPEEEHKQSSSRRSSRSRNKPSDRKEEKSSRRSRSSRR